MMIPASRTTTVLVSLLLTISALNPSVSAFDIRQAAANVLPKPKSPSSLSFRNDKSSEDTSPVLLPYFLRDIQSATREKLKKELALVSIDNYNDQDYNNGHAEEVMKQLERVNPWPQPAYDPRLNARWSFVFTGVPTIGMRLITLLSRLSVGVKQVIDFRDVYLEVQDQSTRVIATVAARVLGRPIELKVYTKLEPPSSDPKGTFLIEALEKLEFCGVEIPLPQEWKQSRSLEITYLDEDMMIARTAGGEPHLLLRHSTCSTDDEECDIDHELTQTQYLRQARAKYGPTLTRSLVDRDFHEDAPEDWDVAGVVRMVQDIVLDRKGSH